MTTNFETITPAKAREYYNTSLGDSTRRRPISKAYVYSYADTMRKGRWLLNGEPIVFDTNGVLINGCHRMLAVEAAGIPVQFEVKRGVAPEAFTTYDNGRRRTLGQLLCMQGAKNYNLIASIVIANSRLMKSGKLWENNSAVDSETAAKATNDDNYLIYRQDEEGYDNAAKLITKLQSRCRILSGSWAGGIYYYLTHTGQYEPEEVEPFFVALFSLESSPIVPADLLRKRITDASLQGKKLKAEMLFALFAKAWNAYIQNIELKRLAYDAEKEKYYPRLITKYELKK